MQVSLLPPRTIHRNDISTSRYNAERTLCHPFETRLAGEWTGRGSVEKKRRRKKKKEKKSYQPPPNYQWSRGDPSPSTTVIYHSTTFRKRFRARHSLDYFKHTRGARVHEMRELAELRPVPEQSIDLSTRLFAGNAARINRRVHIIFEKSIDRERGRLVGNGFRKFIFQFFSWFFFSLSPSRRAKTRAAKMISDGANRK